VPWRTGDRAPPIRQTDPPHIEVHIRLHGRTSAETPS
jgi:hypothetical protein